MSIKIEVLYNALICTDTVSGNVLISQPSKDIWYKEKDLVNGRISLYKTNVNSEKGADEEIPYIDLSEAIDSSLSSFDASTFRTFMYSK